MPKRFPTEIRTQAMEQLRAGQEMGGVAKELGVPTTVRYGEQNSDYLDWGIRG